MSLAMRRGEHLPFKTVPFCSNAHAGPIRAATLVYITTAFSKLSQLSSRSASIRQPLFSVK